MKKDRLTQVPTQTSDAAAATDKGGEGLDRRQLLGTLGALGTGALAGGFSGVGTSTPAAAAEIMPDGPEQRSTRAFVVRQQAAVAELQLGSIAHDTNGDEEMFATKIGNFTKTLPHNNLGEVDPVAYNFLLSAIGSGDFAMLEAVPTGGPAGGTRSILNPLGGLTFSIEGPDSPAVTVTPPPSLSSPEFAAQLAELYWMALLRDVPFSQYDTHPDVLAARQDLATYSGYTGPRDPFTGEIGANDLFRVSYPGAQDGPLMSQFLLQPFTYDGVPIVQQISTAAPGQDFLTSFDEWLAVQRGVAGSSGADPRDPQLRFVRNARDLGRTAGQDRINSQYFKVLLIFGGRNGLDDANPYKSATRQSGFATFGLAHAVELVGKVHKSERHTWYQKWNVHRFLRPEAASGRVHNVKVGAADYPIHSDLINDDELLDRVFELNRQRNASRPEINQSVGTYLLPQLFRRGSPTHPSFPAGHAVTAGACTTFLKAWFKEDTPFPNPKKPTDDGLALEDYVAGVDGPELTVGGELNKLAHNLSWGRDMSGVHWRADDFEGNRQGEEVAIRILREEKATYPEPFTGFSLTKFDGTTITV